MTTVTTSKSEVVVEERYRKYAFDSNAYLATTVHRSASPDLMGALTEAEEDQLLAEGYEAMALEDRALAEGDMAAGRETLDSE